MLIEFFGLKNTGKVPVAGAPLAAKLDWEASDRTRYLKRRATISRSSNEKHPTFELKMGSFYFTLDRSRGIASESFMTSGSNYASMAR